MHFVLAESKHPSLMKPAIFVILCTKNQKYKKIRKTILTKNPYFPEAFWFILYLSYGVSAKQ